MAPNAVIRPATARRRRKRTIESVSPLLPGNPGKPNRLWESVCENGRESGIAGYYRLLLGEEGSAELVALFVEPAAIGTGVGRQLWEHAVATARALDVIALLIQSDPYAEGFYRAMGAQWIGESQSTVIPGRMLPLLRYTIERQDRPHETAQ